MLKALYYNFKQQLDNHHKLIITVLFLVYLMVGLFIYNDYGLSWDETLQWKVIGHATYNFAIHGVEDNSFLAQMSKYHGPAFELLLIFAEKALSLSDSREIFLMRHLITFLVFFISAIVFYFLAFKIFQDKYLSLIAVFMYVLSPHIFSHSFYNSKDTAFLAFFVMSIYALLLFHEKQTYLLALLFAFISAFTIDIRIAGIIIPAISITIYLIGLLSATINKTKVTVNHKAIFTYFVFLFPFIILLWPVLWQNPIHHLLAALKDNSHHVWDGQVLYFGEYYPASKLPCHYLPFWIFISKPIIYSLLFLVGILIVFKQFISKPVSFLKEKNYEIIICCWFFLPLIAVVVFKGVTFDTGRHLYFMHGGFVLIAILGLKSLHNILRDYKILLYTISIALFVSFFSVSYSMVKLHPYQHLYFNVSVGTDMRKIQEKFEMDYWGLSSRQVLEKILENDFRDVIKILPENYPADLNVKILPQELRKRIMITDAPEKANYFIADYRWTKPKDYPYQREFYSVKVGSAKIATAFLIKNEAMGSYSQAEQQHVKE